MRNRIGALTLAAALLVMVVPALAHHGFADQFDWKKPMTLTGTVTKVDWTAPHAVIRADARDANGGATASWAFELGTPSTLMKYGWTQNLIKPGDAVTVDGWAAIDGSNLVSVKSVKLADGRELFGASSFFDMRPAGVVGTSGSGKPAARPSTGSRKR